MALLEVKDLAIAVAINGRLVPVVRGISFEVEAGTTLGIVGESGCGKSLTSLAIMGLLEGSQVRITSGSIVFDGQDLLALPPERRRAVMGADMAMIFQEPMTSLNPVYRVGDQITESILQHRRISRAQARERAIELLRLVRIPDPEGRIDSFPHQLSGGMRQRVMIAMALACDPKLLIADEPTTALDVTVQARILDLMKELQAETGMAIMLISHDLGVIAETCDTVAVMYWGKIIETAPAAELFADMAHPYTRGLLASIPVTDREVDRLEAIPSRVPLIGETVTGCAFHPRCGRARPVCADIDPAAIAVSPSHSARCHFPGEDSA
ncbi:peptide/nickel transport system ATP-binding protein [Hoeflea marina]|uniref:Peptide/nickel transport system ATP-binding protein n=1 Tax=Hoeflea marina TaxID=274592 RepID=A0A317PJU4_9HYPH|nr:ABC transporter ATP-binding protein [Hoeflea marina]PWV98839.1 peptide/nickel transport system ATP-binding protein [Hoeflea marina]